MIPWFLRDRGPRARSTSRASARLLWLSGLAAALATALPLGPAQAQPLPPLDPELQRALQADQASSPAPAALAPGGAAPLSAMNPAMSLILDVGGAWFSRDGHRRQGGHALAEQGLALQGLELTASASVDPYFSFDLAYQLTEGELEEGYATTLALPAGLQARAGLFNAAFGRENPLHLHSWSFANPSLMHTRFLAAEHFAGAGAELSWLLPLPWSVTLVGALWSASEAGGLRSATFAAAPEPGSGADALLDQTVYAVRAEQFLALTHDWSLLTGLSGASGPSALTAGGRSALCGADLYLKWRPVSRGQGDRALALTVEYTARRSAPADEQAAWDGGGYAQLDTMFARRWQLALRLERTGRLGDEGPDATPLPGTDRRGSLALTFRPTHFSALRLQYDLGEDSDRPGGEQAIFLQLETSAGEHGVHRF